MAHYILITLLLSIALAAVGVINANKTDSELELNVVAPKSDKTQILNVYEEYFFKPRSHEDPVYKAYVREGLIKKLQDLGYKSAFLQRSDFEYRRKPASSYNIIGILPGRHRHTKDDQILLVGAHWDSYNQAPGVDDNASGVISILEIARLLSVNKCSFNHTIMFVWFDYEEQGKYGSEFFVNDYLYPKELEKYGSKFIGAFIMDMVLVRDKENNTQTLPGSLKQKLHGFVEELDREKNKGDFLATWSRRTHDEPLENAFRQSWQGLGFENRTFKAMRPELPQDRTPNSEERYEWRDFFRSDHASFWFPSLITNAVFRAPSEQPRSSSRPSLNAILLTDLGPWRKSYSKCYHSSCDDKHLLTDGNLAFMQQVIDALAKTLMRLGHGRCELPRQAPQPPQPPQPTQQPETVRAQPTTTTTTPTPQPAPQQQSTTPAPQPPQQQASQQQQQQPQLQAQPQQNNTTDKSTN